MPTSETALFVTCLVDAFYPEVGEAAVSLLERAGARVAFPLAQTCCGQPLFNMGYRDEAREIARRFITIFEPYEAVVAPSGSCTSMVRVFCPELFHADPAWHARAERLAAKTFELTEYLAAKGLQLEPRSSTKVVCHDSCHLLRELGAAGASRSLLRATGAKLCDLADDGACCGFGGAFSVKLPSISSSMLSAKLDAAEASGAEVLTAADCGCLMQISGGLRRRKSPLRVRHVAEILAGAL